MTVNTAENATATMSNSEQQAKAQLDSIREMVFRLEHCREFGDTTGEHGEDNCEVKDFGECTDFYEYHDTEDAEQDIQEDALSVEVRSDWYTLDSDADERKPSEFRILLCTGGPAVQIRGELDEHGEPERAWLEHQDWGTPWTHYYEEGAQDVLLTYARQFYYGE